MVAVNIYCSIHRSGQLISVMHACLLALTKGKAAHHLQQDSRIMSTAQAQGLNEDPVIVGAMCGAYAHAGAAEVCLQ